MFLKALDFSVEVMYNKDIHSEGRINCGSKVR